MRIIKNIVIASLYVQIIPFIALYAFFIRAIIKLGKIPYYNNPDPGELGFKSHYELVHSLSNLIPITLIALFVSLVYFVIKREMIFGIDKKHFIVSIVLVAVEVLILTSPLMVWFWD